MPPRLVNLPEHRQNLLRLVRSITWFVLAVLAGHLVIAGTAAVASLLHDLALRDDVTYPEGASIYLARQAQQGEPVFRDFTDPPYVPALYGPLSYYSIGWLGRLMQADTRQLYLIGRWLSLGSACVTFVVVWILLWRRYGVGWIGACIAVLFCLSAVRELGITANARPDMPAAALAVLGILLAHRGSLVPAALCMASASLFKQSFVAAPISVGLWLLGVALLERYDRHAPTNGKAESVAVAVPRSASRPLRRALTFGLVYGGLMLALWGWSYVVFGDPLVQNLIWANVLPMDWVQGAREVWANRDTFFPAVAAAAVHGVMRVRRRECDLVTVYSIVSFLIGSATIAKHGGAVNHYLEFLIAASCALGCWIHHVCGVVVALPRGGASGANECAENGNRPAIAHVFAVAAVTVVTVSLAAPQARERLGKLKATTVEMIAGEQPGTVTDDAVLQHVLRLTARSASPLLCSDPYLSAMSEREPVAIDWFLWRELIDAGQVQAAPCVERIARREFDVVILQFDLASRSDEPLAAYFCPAAIAAALADHYRLHRIIGRFHIYVPGGRPEALPREPS